MPFVARRFIWAERRSYAEFVEPNYSWRDFTAGTFKVYGDMPFSSDIRLTLETDDGQYYDLIEVLDKWSNICPQCMTIGFEDRVELVDKEPTIVSICLNPDCKREFIFPSPENEVY